LFFSKKSSRKIAKAQRKERKLASKTGRFLRLGVRNWTGVGVAKLVKESQSSALDSEIVTTEV
jgi:hypothetical protein